jgi:hypothetical protein
MEQRVYSGNVSPNGLADFLVNTFNQGYGNTVAQKMGQGDNVYVQVGILSHSGRRIRGAIGLSIAKTQDGISVTSGQSNWLDFNDPAFTGGIIAGFFFPPLWLFPLARGINNYRLYQDIWDSVDSYCLQAGAKAVGTTTAHGVYCQNCGAVNDENATECAMCGAPLRGAQAGQAPQYQPSTPHYQPSSSAQTQAQGTSSTGPGTVVCPNCGATVSAGKYCSNCAAALPTTSAPS